MPLFIRVQGPIHTVPFWAKQNKCVDYGGPHCSWEAKAEIRVELDFAAARADLELQWIAKRALGDFPVKGTPDSNNSARSTREQQLKRSVRHGHLYPIQDIKVQNRVFSSKGECYTEDGVVRDMWLLPDTVHVRSATEWASAALGARAHGRVAATREAGWTNASATGRREAGAPSETGYAWRREVRRRSCAARVALVLLAAACSTRIDLPEEAPRAARKVRIDATSAGGDAGWPDRTLNLFPGRFKLNATIARTNSADDDSVAMVQRAVRWLISMQRPDGTWSDGTARPSSSGARPADVPNWSDALTTSVVILALQGAGGRLDASGDMATCIGRGVEALARRQEPDGRIIGDRDDTRGVAHAMAACALVDGYLQDQTVYYLEPAQRAVSFLVRDHRLGLAWHDGPASDRTATRATAAAMAALDGASLAQDAEWAPFVVPETCWSQTTAWLTATSSQAGTSRGTLEARAWITVVARSRMALRQTGGEVHQSSFIVEFPAPPTTTSVTVETLFDVLFGSLAANRATDAVRADWESHCERWLLSRVGPSSRAWRMDDSPDGASESVLGTALAVLILETPFRTPPRVVGRPTHSESD